MKSEQKKDQLLCWENLPSQRNPMPQQALSASGLLNINLWTKRKSACAFFLKIVRYHLQRNFFSWIFSPSYVYETHTKKIKKITALHKVCPMHFFIDSSILTLGKKICFKLKVLSQEQSLTPILFKLSSLSSSNRHWAQRKSIKNPCA